MRRRCVLLTVLFLLVSGTVSANIPVSVTEGLINGEPGEFHIYRKDGESYYRLRDLAKALRGTENEFNVSYDDEGPTVILERKTNYKAPVINSPIPDTKVRLSTPNIIFGDTMKPVPVSGYLIDGYNYFPINDLKYALRLNILFSEGKNGPIIRDLTATENEEPTSGERCGRPMCSTLKKDLK